MQLFTLLPSSSNKLVCCSSRQSISIAILKSSSVFNREVKELEGETPSCKSGIVLFQLILPLERSVISLNCELPSEQVDPE